MYVGTNIDYKILCGKITDDSWFRKVKVLIHKLFYTDTIIVIIFINKYIVNLKLSE